MSERTIRCVVVASTGGAVMNRVLHEPFVHRQIVAVVSDRPCGALEHATAHGIPAVLLHERRAAQFCDRLLEWLEANQIEYVISFYTKLFVGPLLERYHNRIINLHPALLPAFKGLNGFEDTLASGVCVGGTTIHFIDAAMDAGMTIMQTVFPIDPALPVAQLRHRVFQHQCTSLVQVLAWLVEDRISIVDGRVVVAGGRYDSGDYIPALDTALARNLSIPYRQEAHDGTQTDA